ncbi:hypothetical protein [Pseudochrobactrum asaccharolyticum]|nr:hypothetical protein [Pseudochrobactrum asaccharolyticum]
MLARLLDRPQNPETVIDFYMATAEALEPRMIEGRQLGEPGFVLLQSSVNLSVPGTVRLEVGGVFFENGHLGDYSNPVERTAILSIVVAEGQVSVGAL